MVNQTVKQKLPTPGDFLARRRAPAAKVLAAIALLTFIFSLLPLPSSFIEAWFSRRAFPRISTVFALIADPLPVAWLDVLILAGILYICVCALRRRWPRIVEIASVGYLIFFWSWGLNYHRMPMTSKLSLNDTLKSTAAMNSFVKRTAEEVNSLYVPPGIRAHDDNVEIRALAADRVARVVERLDGRRWLAPRKVKVSILGNLWFRIAGIDGVFNPIVHEPVVNGRILDVEWPFVTAHELAHVRGYPDEGDANFVALMATLMSEDRRMQYSGWLHLWLYMRTRESDALIDAGPKQDIRRIFDRMQRDEIRWVSNLQATILDVFLKANSVPEGVRSYSRIVLMAAETQESWNEFR